MSESNAQDARKFQQDIYSDLDEKLKSSSWNSGVSEAHGMLAGLACRGVRPGEIKNKMYLFRISDDNSSSLLEGLFELIVRDLDSENPLFNILLPGEETGNKELAMEIADWCEGFFQGFCFDGDKGILNCSESTRELIDDMIEIGNIDITSIENDHDEDERSLVEIEEYLRVGIQVIYDENVQNTSSGTLAQSTEIH